MTTDRINHAINNSKDSAIIDRPKRIRRGSGVENWITFKEIIDERNDDNGCVYFKIREDNYVVTYYRPSFDLQTIKTIDDAFSVPPDKDLVITWELA